jgi:hypothetical protein
VAKLTTAQGIIQDAVGRLETKVGRADQQYVLIKINIWKDVKVKWVIAISHFIIFSTQSFKLGHFITCSCCYVLYIEVHLYVIFRSFENTTKWIVHGAKPLISGQIPRLN